MYSSDDSKNLASIKSRMGWQVGLQAGTLLAIGNLNSSVQNQTEIISSELQKIQNIVSMVPNFRYQVSMVMLLMIQMVVFPWCHSQAMMMRDCLFDINLY